MAIEQARDVLGSSRCAPTAAELADFLDTPLHRVDEGLRAAEGRVLRSLDAPARDDGRPASLGEVLGARDAGFDAAEARAVVERLFVVLDARAQTILRLRFEHDLTQTEIGRVVGHSQMHVSRLLRAAIDRLQRHAATGEAPAQLAA